MMNRIPAEGPSFQVFGNQDILGSWRQLTF
jgi:hypothetical protein